MSRAFTATGCKIERKLSSEITVQKDEKTYKTIALWDTGASGTCISQDVINELALNPSGCVDMATPSGSSKANTYILDLLLPNHVKVKDLIVIGSEIGKQRIGVLVGMDVITKGDFAVSNYEGKTSFTFRIPSKKKTDYVVESNVEKIIGPTHGKGKRKRNKK